MLAYANDNHSQLRVSKFSPLMLNSNMTNTTVHLKVTTLVVALSSALLPMSALASGETEKIKDSNIQKHVTETVKVFETALDDDVVTLDAQALEIVPNNTGTVNDALRGVSQIGFNRNTRSSSYGAEIAAPRISINGSKPYENSYTINGLSNTNTLNPGESTMSIIGAPSGSSQSYQLSPELLETVNVFTENVSAVYGDFTGGVVDARLQNADLDSWHGKAWMSYTGDKLARQHYDGDPDEATEHVTFDRYRTGAYLKGPLVKGKLGAMVAYERHWSVQPYPLNNGKYEDNKQTNQNVLLKVNTDPNADHYAGLTFMYAPFERHVATASNKNGIYDINGGGWNAMLNTRLPLSIGEWSNDLSYGFNEVTRDTGGNNIMFRWSPILSDGTPSKYADWSTARVANDGLFGDHEQEQHTFHWRSALALNAIDIGQTQHLVRVGGEVKNRRIRGHAQGSIQHWGIAESETVKGDLSDGVVAGEQYANKRFVRIGSTRHASVFNGALFAEDRMKYARLTLRPGIRLTWDDVSHNVDIAPRLFADVDLLGDDRFHINGGINRYYGEQIVNLGLAVDEPRYLQTRKENPDGTLTAWAPNIPNKKYKTTQLGDVDTPYSDEYALGASANVQGYLVKLKAVQRKYRDQLRVRDQKMVNSGAADYKAVDLSVEKTFNTQQFGQHTMRLGLTRADLTGNTTDWSTDWSGEGSDPNFVYLDGKLVAKTDLPQGNYYPDWTATFTHEGRFVNDRLRTMLLVRYESARDVIISGFPPFENGYDNMVTRKQHALINADLRLEYDLMKVNSTAVTLDLSVLNLADRKNAVASTNAFFAGTYMMGRQFFVGLKAQF